jgi:hypothetical protein
VTSHAAAQDHDRAQPGARLQRDGLGRELRVEEPHQRGVDPPRRRGAVHDRRARDDLVEGDHGRRRSDVASVFASHGIATIAINVVGHGGGG